MAALCAPVLALLRWQEPFQLTDSDVFLPYTNRRGRNALVGLRALFAAWSLVIVLLSVSAGEYRLWLFKMTGWTFLMTMMYFAMSAYYSYADEDCPPDENSSGRKITFLLYETAFSWSPIVLLLFWSFLYSSDYTPKTPRYLAVAVHTHLVGFVWLLLDLVWNKVEFMPSHLFVIVPAGLAMVASNFVYNTIANPEHLSIHTWRTGTVWTSVFFGIVGGFFVGYALSYVSINRRRRKSFVYASVPFEEDDAADAAADDAEYGYGAAKRAGGGDDDDSDDDLRNSLSLSSGPRVPRIPPVIFEEKYDDDEYSYTRATTGSASTMHRTPSLGNDMLDDAVNAFASDEEPDNSGDDGDGADEAADLVEEDAFARAAATLAAPPPAAPQAKKRDSVSVSLTESEAGAMSLAEIMAATGGLDDALPPPPGADDGVAAIDLALPPPPSAPVPAPHTPGGPAEKPDDNDDAEFDALAASAADADEDEFSHIAARKSVGSVSSADVPLPPAPGPAAVPGSGAADEEEAEEEEEPAAVPTEIPAPAVAPPTLTDTMERRRTESMGRLEQLGADDAPPPALTDTMERRRAESRASIEAGPDHGDAAEAAPAAAEAGDEEKRKATPPPLVTLTSPRLPAPSVSERAAPEEAPAAPKAAPVVSAYEAMRQRVMSFGADDEEDDDDGDSGGDGAGAAPAAAPSPAVAHADIDANDDEPPPPPPDEDYEEEEYSVSASVDDNEDDVAAPAAAAAPPAAAAAPPAAQEQPTRAARAVSSAQDMYAEALNRAAALAGQADSDSDE